jgi:pyridinium-3,5-biscarboxylic acid mononucleotide sulfurtransferase
LQQNYIAGKEMEKNLHNNLNIESENLITRLDSVKSELKAMGSAAVAFSGGVDSTFLLKVAAEVLGDNVIAVTLKSPSFPKREIDAAVSIAGQFNVKHLIIESREFENPDFIKNDNLRCYYCKKEEFGKIINKAQDQGITFVIDGQNYDDISDYRPGVKAAHELGVISPLKNNRLTKDEIRKLSKEMGIAGWDKPSFACLVSRIPYGTQISKNLLEKIGHLEEFLINEGFTQVRVRHHGEIARIEIEKEDFSILFGKSLMPGIISEFKKAGYLYVTLDLEGYRTGSMNIALKNNN